MLMNALITLKLIILIQVTQNIINVCYLSSADVCVSDCVCPCGWMEPPKNYTPKELEMIIVEIQEKLKVTKTSLSSVVWFLKYVIKLGVWVGYCAIMQGSS